MMYNIYERTHSETSLWISIISSFINFNNIEKFWFMSQMKNNFLAEIDFQYSFRDVAYYKVSERFW